MSRAVRLTEEDGVPGSRLPHPEVTSNTLMALKRWLECRGKKIPAKRSEVVASVSYWLKQKDSHLLHNGIDGGKWIKMKEQMFLQVDNQCGTKPIPPILGWRRFPSVEIPPLFNKGHIYHHLVDSMPTLQLGPEDEDSGEEEVGDIRPGCQKPFKKGKGLEFSGFVMCAKDCDMGGYYFFKAEVRKSMKKDYTIVTITFKKDTGFVVDADCSKCPVRKLGRCCHVAACLWKVLHMKDSNDNEETTTTGKERQWGQGAKVKRNPGKISEKHDYYVSYNTIRRYSHDPRPKAHQLHDWTTEWTNSIHLETKWASYLKEKDVPGFCYALPFKHKEMDSADPYVMDWLQFKMEHFMQALHKLVQKSGTGIEGTEDQANSYKWRSMRSVLITASVVRQFYGLKSQHAKFNFIAKRMWMKGGNIQTKAMKWGIDNEDKARKAFVQYLTKKNPEIHATVKLCGLHLDEEHPMLGCSPDGIVLRRRCLLFKTLLEIKCTYVLRNCDPNECFQKLTKKQLNNFCLYADDNGKPKMKTQHPYYFQIQMSLDILKLSKCDFVIWSPYGILHLEVERDVEFWQPIKVEIVRRYYSFYLPEYFLWRVPRGLLPFEYGLESQD